MTGPDLLDETLTALLTFEDGATARDLVPLLGVSAQSCGLRARALVSLGYATSSPKRPTDGIGRPPLVFRAIMGK